MENERNAVVIEIGTCDREVLYLTDDDLKEHVAIYGRTGTGKSVLTVNCALQLIEQEQGVTLIDPDNDTAEELYHRIVERQDDLSPLRRRDIIYLKPGIDRCFHCDVFERNISGVEEDAWLATRIEMVMQIMCRKEQIEDLKEFRRMSRILENVLYLVGTEV